MLALSALVALVIATVPITRGAGAIHAPPRSAVVTTSGAWASMIYLFRADDGSVGVVDLGWWGNARPLDRGLRLLGARREDVRMVFLTHGHRDHIAAWPLLPRARYVLARAEVGRLVGEAPHHGFVPRLADRIWPPRLPAAGALDLATFTGDTAIVVGSDTVRAFTVPGHTAGSAAYLVRGVLFAGDALNWRAWTGFRGARPEMSDDAALSGRNLATLLTRLGPAARTVCSAHAKCARVDDGLVTRITR